MNIRMFLVLLCITSFSLYAMPKKNTKGAVVQHVAKTKKLSKEQEEDALLEQAQKEVQAAQVKKSFKVSNDNSKKRPQDFVDLEDLFWATVNGHPSLVRCILKKNVKIINLQASKLGEDTPLMAAVFCDSKEIVEALLKSGADPNLKNKEGATALMYASQENRIELVKLLLENGADPHLKSNNESMALMIAAQYGHEEIVKMLLHAGADPDFADSQGDTALMHAAEKGKKEVFLTLLSNGADLNVQNKQGYTGLMYATGNDHADIVKLLLENCADLRLQNNEGKTALIIAKDEGFLAIAKMIENHTLAYDLKQKNEEKLLQPSYQKWKQRAKNSIVEKNKEKLLIAEEKSRRKFLIQGQMAICNILQKAHVFKQDLMRKLLESQENQERSDIKDFFEAEIIYQGRPSPVSDWNEGWNPEDFEKAQRIMQGSD